MDGLMMDYPLTITAMLRRTESMFRHKEIVSRRVDKTLERSTYGEALGRARRLASGLEQLGIGRGDRVATLCWNHLRHLEAYFGVPSSGAVLHTLNLRLHPDELAYIATHAGDVALIVDQSLVPLAEQLRGRTPFRHVIVVRDDTGTQIPVPDGALDYEAVVASGDPAYAYPELAESDAVMRSSTPCIAPHSASRVRQASERSACLILAKIISIGFRSGL